MTNSETKNFSQNVSSSYHLEDRGKNTCAQIRNVPKLRFKGYNDEWKEYRLKDIVTRITRKNKKLESDRPLTISAIDGLIDQKDYFNRQIASKDISGYYLLKNGEFAYNKSYSNGYPYGSIKRLNKYDKGALSTLYICFSLRSFCSDFLEKYFETDKWYKEIYMIAVEGARNHGLLNISVDDFFNTMHKFPSLPEQEKIASFLTLIDKKIEKQKEIVKLLKKYKRGLLSKIFSNISTFIKLSDISTFISSTNTFSNISEKINGYPFYDASGISKYIDKYDLDKDYISIVKDGSGVGRLQYCVAFSSFIGTMGGIIAKNCSTSYLYVALHTVNFSKFINGMAIPHIYYKDYKNVEIPYPNIYHQELIANLFLKFEQEIEKQSKFLDLLILYKRGLLQQMFI